MSGNQVNPEQGMLDSNQRMRESKSRALPLGECPIYCHMKAMASIWPNIIAMLMSLVIAVSFSFNVALVIPNAINASHTVVAIFSTNMIYTSKSNRLYFLSILPQLCTQELKTLLRLPLSIGQKRVFRKTYKIKLSMYTGP